MKPSKRRGVVLSPNPGVATGNGAQHDQIFEPAVAAGCIDIFGYTSAAGGWLFSGWIPRPFRTDQSELIDCLVQFEQTQCRGRARLAFYQREDLDRRNIGVVAFASASSRAAGKLQHISFSLDGIAYRAQGHDSTQRLQDREIVDHVRPTLTNQAFANRNREHLLSVISRPGFLGQETLSALSEPVLLEIDEAILCPPSGVLIKGWQLSAKGAIRAIRVRSGPLSGELSLSDSIGVVRPDVITAVGAQTGFSDARCGFVAYVPGAISSGDTSYLEVELENGEVGFKSLRISRRLGMDAIKRILEGIDVRYGEIDNAFDRVLGPAVSALNAARLQEPVEPYSIQFGPIVERPKYSLVVPLYGRVDFLEYQMALFSRHAGIKNIEIIYVLDDPPKRRELEALAHSTHERFGVPFRLLILPSNLGFAPANNVGLRHTRGEYICFLNSDIFPITDHWLEDLVHELEENPTIGVIGARLLFEDGSIQHEGCYFRAIEEFGNWTFIDHYNKGRRPGVSGGLKNHQVITGACMIMRRALALELGGFDEGFIVGDFEDSDLCLKVRERGLSCAVDEDVQLYHLERKSQVAPSQSWRMNLTLYNAWVHQRRWFNALNPRHIPALGSL